MEVRSSEGPDGANEAARVENVWLVVVMEGVRGAIRDAAAGKEVFRREARRRLRGMRGMVARPQQKWSPMHSGDSKFGGGLNLRRVAFAWRVRTTRGGDPELPVSTFERTRATVG